MKARLDLNYATEKLGALGRQICTHKQTSQTIKTGF